MNMTDAELERLTLSEFIPRVDKAHNLQLTEEEVKKAIMALEEQWFTNAKELKALDSEAIRFIDLPPRLSRAILATFSKDENKSALPVPVYSPPPPTSTGDEELNHAISKLNIASDNESDDGGASDPENGESKDGGGAEGPVKRQHSKANLTEVIKHVMEQSGNNPFVMQGLKKLLKQGIADSDKGTMKQQVLREYLKQVSKEDESGAVNLSIPEVQENEDEDKVEQDGNSCGVCHGQKSKHHLLDCKHLFCKVCIHDFIMELVGQKQAVGIKCPIKGCNTEIGVAQIQQLISADEFNQYLEATLASFIEHDNLSFPCPNNACGSIISVEPFKPQDVPNPMTEKDGDGNLLTPEAWLHFQEFRVRCRVCNTVFCASCKQVPYHKGFTCAKWVEYQKARHCRFCGGKLDNSNLAKDPPAPSLRDVCTNDECLVKRDNSCTRTKECGCNCNGVRGEDEKDCLPCLTHELNVADEYCAICYVEALKDAPCVQLAGDCSHVLHFHCVKAKLEARWPGARIGFEFMCCPLCKKEMNHPALNQTLEPIKALKTSIEGKAIERLKYESMDRDPQIVNPGGRFYNDPVGFAMHQFLFYECHKCKGAYFAGGYQCQEADAPFNPEELMCPKCQPQSCDDCPVHGKDWLAYKCRYCCNYANWYCWGRTHFCDQCHKSGVWQKLCEFRTGKNKKKVWEYAQCPGLKAAVEAIAADKSLNDADKEKKMEKVLANPAQCPIGVAHPPNGFEYGLGCSMCEDKKNENKNKEAAIKAQQEMEQKRKLLDNVRAMLKGGPREFKYQSDLDTNGVFYFLGTLGLTKSWSNPADSGFVRVSSSGMMADSTPVSAAIGREVVRCVTQPIRNSWIMFDLIDFSLEPAYYTVRHYSSWDTECLRNWVLEGSNDGVAWDCLRAHRNDASLNKKGSTASFPLNSGGKRYRMFRIIQTGTNSNNHYYLSLSGFELYGALHESVPEVKEEIKVVDEEEKADIKEFKYQYEFDTNGIMYYLGTNCGQSKQWQNPALLGNVIVTSTQLAEQPPSKPASALVGRELVRLTTVAKPNMWFMVDLKDKKAVVTHYTLRHYNSWDTEALRNWRFEGSNDGLTWVPLSVHVNDAALRGKGATYTWKIDKPESRGAFSMFRILQTGKNSNNHYYLACSGLEMYGQLIQTPPVNVPPQGVELKYSYDFDANGLFYWLGTRGKRQAWRNPAEAGTVRATASMLAQDPPSTPASAICGRTLCRCVSAASPNMWFAVDLKDKKICITHYTLRHYNSWDTEALRNWVLEASNDGFNWSVLVQHVNDRHLDKKGATYTWPVNAGDRAFRIIRIRQTGLNSNNHHYLSCSGLELYGTLLPITSKDRFEAPSAVAIPPPEKAMQFKDGLEFKYQSDLDMNGIVYWLGTAQRTRPYRNPGETGALKVTSSPLASQSHPAWAACGREVVRCVTEPKKSTWFCFDFGPIFVLPTHYTLRHYDTWDTEALRNWKLEGSCDGKKWKTLMSHKKDKALDHKGATHTWPIKGITKTYSMFRIIQTGKNSNKHYYLALSGFEMYGKIYSFRYKG